jgi:Tol biopolymer transport system component
LSQDFIQGVLSPDGRWIAWPLIDGVTTDIWLLPTEGGAMRPITNFGDRQTLIARQVSWAPDGRSIYAAVAETTTDVVLLDGLLDRFHAHGQVTPAADSSGALGSSS